MPTAQQTPQGSHGKCGDEQAGDRSDRGLTPGSSDGRGIRVRPAAGSSVRGRHPRWKRQVHASRFARIGYDAPRGHRSGISSHTAYRDKKGSDQPMYLFLQALRELSTSVIRDVRQPESSAPRCESSQQPPGRTPTSRGIVSRTKTRDLGVQNCLQHVWSFSLGNTSRRTDCARCFVELRAAPEQTLDARDGAF